MPPELAAMLDRFVEHLRQDRHEEAVTFIVLPSVKARLVRQEIWAAAVVKKTGERADRFATDYEKLRKLTPFMSRNGTMATFVDPRGGSRPSIRFALVE